MSTPVKPLNWLSTGSVHAKSNARPRRSSTGLSDQPSNSLRTSFSSASVNACPYNANNDWTSLWRARRAKQSSRTLSPTRVASVSTVSSKRQPNWHSFEPKETVAVLTIPPQCEQGLTLLRSPNWLSIVPRRVGRYGSPGGQRNRPWGR